MPALLLVLALTLLGQSAQSPSGATASTSTPAGAAAQVPADPKRAQLKTDSDALAKAAAELNELLSKTNQDQLSLAVIKKADEVQRLAKQVQKDLKDK